MLILAIDTTGNGGYVALFKGKELLGQHFIEAENQTAILLEKVDDLLKKNELNIDCIDIFAACTGPGSFTGTRIGVMTAKTLAFAKSRPLIGFSSFVGRDPKISFIGKRRIARKVGDEILYERLEESIPMPKLCLNQVGAYLAAAAPGKVEITYPAM